MARTNASALRENEPGDERPPSRTVVEHAIETIKHGIFEGHYVSGQRLIEAELTRALGVSRGPLREALRRLAADGLVEIEPYRGAAVSRMSRAELADALVVREVLEGLAARLAAERIDEPGLRVRAATVMDELKRAAEKPDPTHYLEENDRFHHLIVELSGNVPLGRQIAQLQMPTLRTAFFKLFDHRLQAASLAQHREILEAVIAGDGARAERAMRSHVRRTMEVAKKLPDALFRS
jgi:DNA-binding GntR family transcriptional regulator